MSIYASTTTASTAELLDGSENKSKFQFQSKVSTLRKEDELALMLLSPCRPKSRRPQAA